MVVIDTPKKNNLTAFYKIQCVQSCGKSFSHFMELETYDDHWSVRDLTPSCLCLTLNQFGLKIKTTVPD
jgi:hypothetical protein